MTNNFDFEHFQGFAYPTTTPTPDLLFDHVMQELNVGELKVILYIIRRTFGFKKPTDDISLAQMVEGITTKEGDILDRGTGLSKKTVMTALRSLKEKNLIETVRNRTEERGDLPTTYKLKVASPRGEVFTPGGGEVFTPRGRGKIYTTQQTVKQQTVKQQQQQPPRKSESNTGSGAQDVVVALIKFGISDTVAQRLASRHQATTIYQQLDYHDYELTINPSKIKSPSGRLRTRIEENWAAPDGYTKDWRERLAAEKTRTEQAHQEQQALEASLMTQEGRKHNQQEQQRQEHLAAVKKQYRMSETQEKIWTNVKSELLGRVGEAEYKTFVAGSELLTTDNHQATIWVHSSFLAKAMEKRYGSVLKQLLAQHLHVSPDDLTLGWVYPPSDSRPPATLTSGDQADEKSRESPRP